MELSQCDAELLEKDIFLGWSEVRFHTVMNNDSRIPKIYPPLQLDALPVWMIVCISVLRCRKASAGTVEVAKLSMLNNNLICT